MAYLIDSDVFMQAKNLHYGFDFCPAFWSWLDEQAESGGLRSVDKVREELLAGDDDLCDWAKDWNRAYFLSPDEDSLPSLREVSRWVNSAEYQAAGVNIFLQKADYYLVAQARARGDVVVTHEVPSNSVAKIKIPDVCIGVGVRCVSPFAMLRAEHARFVLAS